MSGFLPNSKAERVYHELLNHSAHSAERFKVYFLQTMFSGTAESEMTLLNRFWRLQLARLPVPTYHERECLCDETDFEPWFMNFRKYVIPTIIQHQLPHPEV